MLDSLQKHTDLYKRCSGKNVQLKYYRKCPKILYIKVADKMAYANSASPDQTAPEGAV